MIYPERNEDISLYHWLKAEFTDAPFVTVTDGFPDELLSTPTVSLEWDSLTGYEFELGNRTRLKERLWYIDIFAKNKSQRDDFAYRIYNDLQDGIPVYNYNEGFPEQGASPTRVATLIPARIEIRNLHKYLETDLTKETELEYFRAVVVFTATLDRF